MQSSVCFFTLLAICSAINQGQDSLLSSLGNGSGNQDVLLEVGKENVHWCERRKRTQLISREVDCHKYSSGLDPMLPHNYPLPPYYAVDNNSYAHREVPTDTAAYEFRVRKMLQNYEKDEMKTIPDASIPESSHSSASSSVSSSSHATSEDSNQQSLTSQKPPPQTTSTLEHSTSSNSSSPSSTEVPLMRSKRLIHAARFI